MVLNDINYIKIWLLIYKFTIVTTYYTGKEDGMKGPRQISITTSNYSEIDNTFKLLKEGEKNIMLSEQYKNIILVVGYTGSGKSTFTQWIAGDNSKLISREEVNNSGEFIIEDGNRISTSTINSKTIFPELVVDSKTQSAFYDCPGFSDTRSTSHDISSTYFIKTVADYVSRIKIVLVVSHHSVRTGVSRNKFSDLIKHVSNLIKNIEKFKKSIAMVVTKVENTVVKKGPNYLLVPDEKVFETIAIFLKQVKGDLEEQLEDVDPSDKKRFFLPNAIKLVDTLLKKDEGMFTRIGIFRRPDEAGPLSNITTLCKGKEHVKKMLYEKLEFTEKNNNDFGYTISAESENDVYMLVEKINEKVGFEISEIFNKIQDYFKFLTEEVQNKINSFVDNREIVPFKETEAKSLFIKLNTHCDIISRFLTENKNIIDIEDLGKKTTTIITRLEIDTCEDNLKNISNQGKYFNFLQVVSHKKLNTRPWLSSFEKIDFCKSRKHIQEDAISNVEMINNKVSSEISKIVDKIQDYFGFLTEEVRNKINFFVNNREIVPLKETEAKTLFTKLNTHCDIISKFLTENKNITDIEDLAKKTMTVITRLEIDTCEDNLKNILNQGKYFNFLQVVSHTKLNTRPWLSSFEKIDFCKSRKHIEEDAISNVERINDKIWSEIFEIVEKVRDYYINLTGKIQNRISSFAKNSEIVYATEMEAKNFSDKLNAGCSITSEFLIEIRNVAAVEDLVEKINSSITRLKVDTCKNNVKEISIQGKFLNFLSVASNRKLNFLQWFSLFEKIDICKLKKDIEKNAIQIAKEINFKINTYIENIVKEIRVHCQKKTETLEIEALPNELNNNLHYLNDLITTTNNSGSVQRLSEKISDIIINLDLSASSKIQSDNLNVLYHGKYLEFLNILNNGVNTWSSNWIIPFNDVSKYLLELKIWYKFLNELYDKFSKYEVQKYKNRYDVANVNDWGKEGKYPGIYINKKNFKAFLEKMEEYDITECDGVKNLEVTELQIKELNSVVDLTLKNKVTLQCPEPSDLVITGDYIKFSDFIYNDELIREKMPGSCKGGDDLRSVHIFALDTVLIDRDFKGVGKKLKFSIIAPKWHTEGTRIINLDGADGNTYAKAKNGVDPGGKGHDGLPGLPGGSAGNFLGIANEFINYKSLTITANGGHGAAGQDGGDGNNGRNGKDGDKDDSDYKLLDKGRRSRIKAILYYRRIEKYLYWGKPGDVGGNGGKGGIGGFGGNRGEIQLIKLDKSSGLPITRNYQGYEGIGGKGGRGGNGGKHGSDLKAKWCIEGSLLIPTHIGWCPERIADNVFEYIPSSIYADPGSDGCSGCNFLGRKQPEKKESFQNTAQILNDYKLYLRSSLVNRFRRHSFLKQFVKKLDNNADIKNSYNTL